MPVKIARHHRALSIALFCTTIAVRAQVTNGPVFGPSLNSVDRELERDYAPVGSEKANGVGGFVGWFVGGGVDHRAGLRMEFLVRMRRYSYSYSNSEETGDYRGMVGSLQIPALLVVRVYKGIRLMAGPGIDVRFLGTSRAEGSRKQTGVATSFENNFGKDLKTLGTSLVFGLEYRTSGALALGVRMDQGLSRMTKDGTGPEAHSMDLSLVLSFDVTSRREAPPATGK